MYVICFCSKITEVRTFRDLICRCFNGYWNICFEWDNNLQPTCLIAPPRKSSLESKIHKNAHRFIMPYATTNSDGSKIAIVIG